jgi:Rab-like protein 2
MARVTPKGVHTKYVNTSLKQKFGKKSNQAMLGKAEADVKVVIIGDVAVGKSKLVERYVTGDYDPRRLTTPLSLYRKAVAIDKDNDKSTVTVDLWDTAGGEKFNSLHAAYYYQADVCILVFDVTRKGTYLCLEQYYKYLRKHRPTIPCIVVANKVDVDYNVTRKNFEFPREHNLPFFFASAADGMNVVKIFEEAVCAGLGQRKYGEREFLTECLELYDNNPRETL